MPKKINDYIWFEYEDGTDFNNVPEALEKIVNDCMNLRLYFIRGDLEDYEATLLFDHAEAGRWVQCDACRQWRVLSEDSYMVARTAGEFTCSDIPGNKRGCDALLSREEERYRPTRAAGTVKGGPRSK